MSDKPLSIRHGRFVQAYLKDGNATRAYIRAGIVELRVRNHSKQEQSVTLKPAARPEEPRARPTVMPGMLTEPPPDHVRGLYPNAKFTRSGGREYGMEADSADAPRLIANHSNSR